MDVTTLKFCVITFLGGGTGSVLRYLLSFWIGNLVGETFPWGTIFVNITGCFVIGLLAALFSTEGRFLVGPGVRQFLLIGVLGGYTTFSSFSLQTFLLARDGEWLYAGGNVVVSVIFCLVGVWLGYLTGNTINALH